MALIKEAMRAVLFSSFAGQFSLLLRGSSGFFGCHSLPGKLRTSTSASGENRKYCTGTIIHTSHFILHISKMKTNKRIETNKSMNEIGQSKM
ncbi:hypothetical protein SUGI_0750970 [Cryptomeria japonica]|nr:hypothetical protein SUGI_0750970 [Cryptomeria japonica]